MGVLAVACLGVRGILDWDDMKGVSWGIFFTIGAGLSLGDALIRTGVTGWVAFVIPSAVTLDPREHAFAIDEGIFDDVDFKEPLTHLSIDSIIKAARPDLVLLTTSPQDMGLGEAAGIDVLSAALHDELATIADVPVIKVARSAS